MLLVCLVLLAAWAGAGSVRSSAAARGMTVVVTPSTVPPNVTSSLLVRVLDAQGNAVPGAVLRVGGARVSGSLVLRGASLTLSVAPTSTAAITIVASRSGFAQAEARVQVEQPRAPAAVAALRTALGIQPQGVSVFRTARLNDPLFFHWRARTSATQRGSLRFADGSVLDMDVNTEVLIKDPARTYLTTGQVFLQVVSGGQAHEIETGTAVAASEGSRYLVRIAGGTTLVRVYSGRVSLRTNRGAVSLGPQEQSSYSAGTAPSAPLSAPAQLPGWIQGLPSAAGATLPSFLYLLRQGGRDLVIFSIDTHRIQRDVPLPVAGHTVVLGNGGGDLFVTTATGVLDVPVPAGNPRTVIAGIQPTALAALPQGQLALTTADGSVLVVDARTGRALRTLSLGYAPTGIAVTPDGARAIVSGVGEVSLLDLAHGTVLTTREVPGVTGQPSISADGTLAFVPLPRQGTLLELSSAARGPLWQLRMQTTGGPFSRLPAALALADGRLLVADGAHQSLIVVDPASQRITASYALGAPPLALTWAPDGKVAVVLGGASSSVAIVDPYDGYVLDRVGLAGLVGTIAAQEAAPSGAPAPVVPSYGVAIGSSVPSVEAIQVAPVAPNATPAASNTATPTAIILPSPSATAVPYTVLPSTPEATATPSETATVILTFTPRPTDTPVPPTDTPVPPTNTPIPSTRTPQPPTNTPIPPTATPMPDPTLPPR